MKHRAQSLRQFLRRRHLVRNPCLSNLCLGAHNALRQRTRSDEEGLGYLLGGQPAHLTQGERNARFRRQRRMTAGKNQAQPIIFKRVILKAVLFIGSFRPNSIALRDIARARLETHQILPVDAEYQWL